MGKDNLLKDSILVYFINGVIALAALATVIYTIKIPGVDAGLVAVVSSISTLIGKTVLDIMMSQSGADKEDPMAGVAKEMISLIREKKHDKTEVSIEGDVVEVSNESIEMKSVNGRRRGDT